MNILSFRYKGDVTEVVIVEDGVTRIEDVTSEWLDDFFDGDSPSELEYQIRGQMDD